MLNLTVLAGSYVEGRRFLADVGLRGSVIHSADSAVGRRPTVLLELPGYATCRSRFAIESMLRTQGARSPIIRMLVDPADFKAPAVPAPAGPGELEGQVTIEQALIAAADEAAASLADVAEVAETPTPRYQPHSKSRAAKAARRKSA